MKVDGQLIRAGAERVSSLPTTDLFEGRQVLWTTDNELYHYVDGGWELVGDVTDSVTPPADQAGQFFVSTASGTGNWDWTSDLLLNAGVNCQFAVTINNLRIKSQFDGFSNNIFLTNQDISETPMFNTIAIGSYDDNPLWGSDFDRNVMIGRNNGANMNDAKDNTFLGYGIQPETEFQQTTVVGSQALTNHEIASENAVAIGYQALQGLSFGATNSVNRTIAIGAFAGLQSQGEDNVYIGYLVGVSQNENNKLQIGNITSPNFIEGDMSADTLQFNADVTVRSPFNLGGMFISSTLGSPDELFIQGDCDVQNDLTATNVDVSGEYRINGVPVTGGGSTTKYQEKFTQFQSIDDADGALTLLVTYNNLTIGNWYKFTWTMDLQINMGSSGANGTYRINAFNGGTLLTSNNNVSVTADVGNNQSLWKKEGFEISFQANDATNLFDIEFAVQVLNSDVNYTGYNIYSTMEEFDPAARVATTDWT